MSNKPEPNNAEVIHQHGINGVWYAGDWLDIEECDGKFTNVEKLKSCSGCDFQEACPRSRTRHSAAKDVKSTKKDVTLGEQQQVYDVVIIGAGCIGSSIARELSKYQTSTGPLSILWVEAADDVSQGATKGNSGIVHAGYDDKPGTNRAKYCWKGNQMFAALDRELRFGYQKNGSLVLAFNETELAELNNLKKRGEINGVQNLRVIGKDELFQMEPYVNKDAIAALYSPDAGNVIPYEFAIALAENACDNGVELRIRTAVVGIEQHKNNTNNTKDRTDINFTVSLQQWEPAEYIEEINKQRRSVKYKLLMTISGVFIFGHYMMIRSKMLTSPISTKVHMVAMVALYAFNKIKHISFLSRWFGTSDPTKVVTKNTPLEELVSKAGTAIGKSSDKRTPVSIDDMLRGGSGSPEVWSGQIVQKYSVQARNVINCAGGAADVIASYIGDKSFKIKPRVGDYLLLKKKQGHLAKHTIFPCPDPVFGKGVLVQTTLWGNLILGPTARDMHDEKVAQMSPKEIQTYILSKCKKLVPGFDPTMTIHAFAGARAKSDRGDWIIEPSKQNKHFIHVAGIDSPGLAGAPAIALEVVNMLQKDGLSLKANPNFKKDRAPIIFPKRGLKGLKMGPIGKNDSDGSNMEQMAANVVCKCEKVTELEVVRAMRRSLPLDSSQGIRKRTRAGMGSCQANPDKYNCEARIRAIIARENNVPVEMVGGRPWPATSTLTQRWIDDNERAVLKNLMDVEN